MHATTMTLAATPEFDAADRAAMRDALDLAQLSVGLCEPNPRVGCVIVGADGRVLGRGYTQAAGAAHAEPMALDDARQRGADVRGATVYVSLEPCAHHGRTPPCCDALIRAGVARVVAAVQDPNPRVAGMGLAKLRAAGIEVETGMLADDARELNIGFFSRMLRGRPWVRMKVAISLDGRTALADGQSRWITGEAARRDGHAWRKRAAALLTGVGTVRDDDPRLDVRLVETPRQPLRVIVDSKLETPAGARILDAPGSVLIYAATPAADRAAALQARGAEVVAMAGTNAKVDLRSMLHDLGERGVNELHVEAGSKLNGSFVRAGLVDEWLVYVAPRLIGAGRDLASFGPLATLGDALALRYCSVERVGDDLRLVLRNAGAPPF